LDDDPELEYEFYLARKLGMTVAQMREELGAGEFILWSRYDSRLAQAEELERRRAG
jgi:hypothetical protein